jgi:uncharacterized membrane protein YidH (DUF202 family)
MTTKQYNEFKKKVEKQNKKLITKKIIFYITIIYMILAVATVLLYLIRF